MKSVTAINGRIVLLILFLLAVILLGVRFWPSSNASEIMNTCVAAGETNGTGAATTTVQTAPPLYLGLDAYRHLDKLSYLELGDRVEGASTADPGGSNADNTHVVRVLPDGEHVLFDQLGPGMMTFMRMQENYGGPWNLSLDGHFTTTVNTSDLGQTNPVSAPASNFPYPLSLNQQQDQGSSIVATSIPFQQSMQWAAQHANGNFYALYRKLPYGSTLPTWNGHEPVNDVVSLLRCAGSDIAPPSISQQQGNLTLAANRETPVVTLNGPAQIRALEFQVSPQEMVGFSNAAKRQCTHQIPGGGWRGYLFSPQSPAGAGLDGWNESGSNRCNERSSLLADAFFLTRAHCYSGRFSSQWY